MRYLQRRPPGAPPPRAACRRRPLTPACDHRTTGRGQPPPRPRPPRAPPRRQLRHTRPAAAHARRLKPTARPRPRSPLRVAVAESPSAGDAPCHPARPQAPRPAHSHEPARRRTHRPGRGTASHTLTRRDTPASKQISSARRGPPAERPRGPGPNALPRPASPPDDPQGAGPANRPSADSVECGGLTATTRLGKRRAVGRPRTCIAQSCPKCPVGWI